MSRSSLAVATFASVLMVLASPPPATAAPGGCPPLGAGSSSFPATATLVLDDQGFGPPFVLRLSSAGHPDAVLQRAAQAGDVIDVQLVQLELAGFHPLLGAVTLRESLSGVSAGQIVDVTLDGTCQLAGGRARLEVQLDLEIGGVGETWIPTGPIHLEAPVGGLPPQDVRLEVPTVSPVPLEDELTGLPRGTLLYTQVHAGPPFPPPGSECFDALLTASVQLFDPPTTSSLFGFGPSRVATGPTIPGGTCNQNGQPCDADSDCQIFDTCKRSRIDTELVQLDVSGSDVHLGDWSMEVLPAIGNSDCCEAHPTGGCSDPACEQWICALDSFCCEVEWDLLCASLAETEPLCEANCLDPDANPSVGRVTSVNLDRTYPAISYFDVFLRIASETAGTLQNQAFVHLQPLAPIRNLPADPDTNWVYGGGPKTLYSASGSPVGQISNVTYTPQALYDCAPPPAAAEDCQSASLQLELTLPPCPPETLSLSGQLRTLRDAPHDGATLGQELIDAVLAQAVFAGTSSCAGPLVARLSSTAASAGTIASLTPPEFFPADASFELHLELATGAGTFTAGPATSAASVNAVPPAAGELFHGPATALPLLDGGGMPAGTFRPVTIELGGPLACTADSRSTIRFTGPSHDDFDVAVPQGGAGVDYDIVRGTLAELHAGAGSFAGAACLFADVGPSQNDAELPLPGDGFYYVSRDGLGSFNGTWNSGGPGQSADRDGLLPSCP